MSPRRRMGPKVSLTGNRRASTAWSCPTQALRGRDQVHGRSECSNELRRILLGRSDRIWSHRRYNIIPISSLFGWDRVERTEPFSGRPDCHPIHTSFTLGDTRLAARPSSCTIRGGARVLPARGSLANHTRLAPLSHQAPVFLKSDGLCTYDGPCEASQAAADQDPRVRPPGRRGCRLARGRSECASWRREGAPARCQ